MLSEERRSIEAELDPGHLIVRPRRTVAPVILCSPHSGRIYPKHFLATSRLDPLALRRSEDCFVDDLIQPITDLGLPMIAARFPRAYLDVNREPYELDPVLFDEPLPDYANSQSVRVAGGLGTIARIVADREEIYAQPPTLESALHRIEKLYKPFHSALEGLIDETVKKFGMALLVDCHSMPSTSTSSSYDIRPDMVLGDRFSGSCDAKFSAFLKNELAQFGYDVFMNRPYAGGFITEHYGRTSQNVHAIQLEINRGLYLDEHRLVTTDGFAILQNNLLLLMDRLLAVLPALIGHRAAAE